MTQESPSSPELPTVAVDHGDLVEVAPAGNARLLSALVGGAAALAGLAVLIVAPGELADAAALRSVIGGVLVVVGVLALFARGRRLAFDEDGVTLHQPPLPARTLHWEQVAAARIEQRHQRTPVGGFARRLPGGLTISAGPGGRRRAGSPGPSVTRDEPVTHLYVQSNGDERDLTLDIADASPTDGERLLASLRERGWVPGHVATSVEPRR